MSHTSSDGTVSASGADGSCGSPPQELASIEPSPHGSSTPPMTIRRISLPSPRSLDRTPPPCPETQPHQPIAQCPQFQKPLKLRDFERAHARASVPVFDFAARSQPPSDWLWYRPRNWSFERNGRLMTDHGMTLCCAHGKFEFAYVFMMRGPDHPITMCAPCWTRINMGEAYPY